MSEQKKVSNTNDNNTSGGKHAASGQARRKVAKTTTRPTKAQERKTKADTLKSKRESVTAARHAAREERKKASREKRAERTAAEKLKTARRIILVLGVLAIAAVVFLHYNAKGERIDTEGFRHDARFSNCIVIDGIDVSYAQGGNIDWKKVKKSGVDFVFIRAGYRGAETGKLNEDKEFQKNMEGATDAGLMVGVYFYSQAISAKEARAEAEYLIGLVEPYEVTLPLVMDYEFFPGGRLEKAYGTGLLTPKFMNNITKEFSKTVEGAGYESMVYANYSFLLNNLDATTLDQNTDIWLAHYAEATDFPEEYSFWQCSANFSVPGIEGDVDRDFWYLDPKKITRAKTQGESDRTSIAECQVELKDHTSTYVGFNVEPGVTVSRDGKKLSKGKDYTVSYVKNTAPGTGYVIVTGIGEYRDRTVQSFMIKEFI